MKVITTNREVVYSSANGESFSYAPENPTKITGSAAQQMIADANKTNSKKKFDWKGNINKGVQFGKDSGLFDMGKQLIANKLGVQNATPTGLTADNTTTTVTVEEKKPMSTTVKVAIGLGIAAVLGFVIYKVTKKK